MSKKNIITASSETILKLRLLAKEKESIRRKLVVTAGALRVKAKQLAETANEKESIRRKLLVTAKKLATTAKEKEIVRRKLVTTAAEKEDTRSKLAVTAEKLSIKAEELAVTMIKQEAILDSIGDAVMACDKEGRIILFNRKAVDVTGFSAKEIIGKHYNHSIKFVREDDNKPSEDFIAEAMKTGHKTTMANNTLLIKKDGSKISVADSAEPIRYIHQVLIGCVIIFRDITKEKEIDKAKSEFISIASHQLKTPATIVNLYTEMLLNDSAGVITLTQKEYINEIRDANQRMADIVNALLNVSRIEMGIFSTDSKSVDAIVILKNVIKELHVKIEEKQIILEEKYHQSEHMTTIDALLLNMVFSNLVLNSIKYSSVGGTIRIKSSEVQKGEKISNNIIKKDSLLVSVSDNGCGIPIDQQSKVFTKFFRSDNARNQHTDGTGLGLYIVKSILGHIGGEVWFSSKEKEGTIFYFTIPSNITK